MMMRSIIGTGCALLLAGCSTVNPLTMERTARDEETYEAAEPIPFIQGRKKVFIVSKVIEHQRSKETNHVEFLARKVRSATSNYLSLIHI